MNSKLNKHILATIIYYDGFDYPLTAFEIWKHMIRTDYADDKKTEMRISLAEVMKQLKDEGLVYYIDNQNGFYFLKGRKNLVEKRIARNKISMGKMKNLRKAVWLLRCVPFVRMVGITGALAMKNAKLKSDLDLLVVLKKGKIWTGRTLVTFFLHILKKRRHGQKIADRVCLNFFITDESLEIITKDLYSASEYMFLFPLFGFENFQRFQIKNSWIKSIKPNYAITEIPPLKIITDSVFSRNLRNFGEKILSFRWIEKTLKKAERKKIMQNPKTHQEGSLIYANDDALVFLPDPHGPKVFEEFKKKVGDLSI
ncbi:MAG TPA: hypothetical protein PLB52_03275 [Candidatus Moranbacteria bacterium]|nr:hypothetical protein [Candidatus Moranbacteria bacterium]